MDHHVLAKIKSDEFAVRFALISNPRAVHRALQRSEEIEDLKIAVAQEQISEGTLRRFVWPRRLSTTAVEIDFGTLEAVSTFSLGNVIWIPQGIDRAQILVSGSILNPYQGISSC